MSQFLFERSARLIIASKEEVFFGGFGGVGAQFGTPTVAQTETTGNAKDIKNLRMNFNIRKTSEPDANRATINVYNMNPSNRGFLEESGTDLFAIFLAGYSNQEKIMFKGDVTWSGSQKQGPDIISTIEAGDGDKKIKKTRSKKTFAPGVNLTQIITTLIGDLGFLIGNVSDIPTDISNTGVSVSGQTSELLTKFLSKVNLEWSVQNNTIEIKPVDQASKVSVVRLTSATGLLGSPIKKKEGIQFTSLLDPMLEPGAPVKIESRFINGIFVCRNVVQEGDTREGPWQSTVEAV